MTAKLNEHNYSPAYLSESIDAMLHVSRTYGIDVHEGLVVALTELEVTGCSSIGDALAFIAVGRNIREQAFFSLGNDLARLYDVHRLCEWFIGIGVAFIERSQHYPRRTVHASNETLQ